MSAELATEVRRELLRLARDSIVAHLAGKAVTVPPELDAGPPRGAFVTLHRRDDHELRGCIGQIEPVSPLGRTVARMALAAAFEDPRFPPVEARELPGLAVEISVLTVPRPIRPEAVEVGRHGLILRGLGRAGLLLPQVPGEHGWDRQTFLEKTCVKAGLPAGAWKHPEVQLLGFTAVVFGEEDAG